MAVPLKQTLLMVGLLAGLGGYAYFYESKQPAPETVAEESKRVKILSFENDQLRMFTVAKGDQSMTLKRGKKVGEWEFAGPLSGPADATRLGSTVDRLKDWNATRKLMENATDADLQTFGLDKPQAVWKPTWAGVEDKPKEIAIGTKNPDDSAYYVQLKPGREVYLSDTYTVDEVLRLVSEPPKPTPTPTPSPSPIPTPSPSAKVSPASSSAKAIPTPVKSGK